MIPVDKITKKNLAGETNYVPIKPIATNEGNTLRLVNDNTTSGDYVMQSIPFIAVLLDKHPTIIKLKDYLSKFHFYKKAFNELEFDSSKNAITDAAIDVYKIVKEGK